MTYHENTLIVIVGLPRSGKTTWARQQLWPIVNPDAIRLAIHGERFISRAEPFVWATAKVMVRALFLAGHATVILDATNTTRKRRDEWHSQDWETKFKVIGTSEDRCLRRAFRESDLAITPVIERMAAQFEPLEADEQQYKPDENEMDTTLKRALHYVECYHSHWPTSGARYVAEELRQAIKGKAT
ncbi:MAG: AAA family ATPase [Gammaproteobacteria bacterium]